jgi:hypothetical protein
MSLRVSAVENNISARPELARIEYDAGRLTIGVFSDGRQIALVQFKSVEGFRVLDEGDLLEFWPMCQWAPGKWLWEIHEGGWFEFESTRPGFIREKLKGAAEYLVVGVNECVSVISHTRPVVAKNEL